MNHWLYLATAIVLEVAGTTAMKYSEGFSRLWPSMAMVVLYLAAFAALTMALKKLDVSVAYAIWAGIGTALIAVIGFVWFDEAINSLKIISIGLIIIGVVGLQLAGSH